MNRVDRIAEAFIAEIQAEEVEISQVELGLIALAVHKGYNGAIADVSALIQQHHSDVEKTADGNTNYNLIADLVKKLYIEIRALGKRASQ